MLDSVSHSCIVNLMSHDHTLLIIIIAVIFVIALLSDKDPYE